MEDIANKKLITLSEVAKILGLKYHTARKILFNSKTIGCVDYGSKKLWVLDEVLDFKRSRYIRPVA